MLNIAFVEAVEDLQESIQNSSISNKQELLALIYKYIIFNFGIWYRLRLSVRKRHIALISMLLQRNAQYFRDLFGVSFFFKMVKLYFTEKEVNSLTLTSQKGAASLPSTAKVNRVALLSKCNSNKH